MRPSPAQIERVAESLVRRLVQAQLLEPDAPEETIRARFAAILGRNFEEEAEIEREASAEAERLVRKGAPGYGVFGWLASRTNACPKEARACRRERCTACSARA